MKMKFKYAVFDMDGTLLDTMKYWHDIIPFYAEMKGLPVPAITDEDAIASIHLPYSERISYLRERYSDEAIRQIEVDDILKVIGYCYEKYPRPKKGVIEMLETLKKAGVRMCIASATPTRLVELALKQSGIRDYFEFILSPDDYPKGKFTPDIFLGIAERFGCDVTEEVLFEDTLYSIKTAKSLGIKTVAVSDDYCTSSKEEMMSAADIYLEDFSEFKFG